jgi:flagellar FliL protein
MATKAKVKEEEGPVAKPGFREKLPKILMNLLIVLNLVGMVGGTLVIYKLKIAYKRPTITEETQSEALAADREIRENHPVLFSFEPFTINLDGRPKKLVRTTIQIEMLNEEGYEEAVELTPIARDQIVKIFNSKKYEDIETIQGKLFLKDEIMTAMNNMLHKGTVKDVYFGDFVVQ